MFKAKANIAITILHAWTPVFKSKNVDVYKDKNKHNHLEGQQDNVNIVTPCHTLDRSSMRNGNRNAIGDMPKNVVRYG